MRKKVSFDFDACLDTDQVFEYAQELKLRDDVEMFITTSRVSDDMDGTYLMPHNGLAMGSAMMKLKRVITFKN